MTGTRLPVVERLWPGVWVVHPIPKSIKPYVSIKGCSFNPRVAGRRLPLTTGRRVKMHGGWGYHVDVPNTSWALGRYLAGGYSTVVREDHIYDS